MKEQSYTLRYRAPGKRPGTLKWATRKVGSTQEAVEWMNAHKEEAFLPAFVETGWRRTVAIIG